MICPASRAGAFAQLNSFLPSVPLYARDRNRVEAGHPAVSRLSPAIRHRLITEDEVVCAVLRSHSLSRSEKFVQEVYWRSYWKSWLSLRPQVWDDYRNALEGDNMPDIRRLEAGDSGNPVIDHFIRELIETGYLHNHARMWFAAWWIHSAGLPWQSGAAFFHRYLLDGDPASNTLSWRWVAGLQTPGKTYLARKSNLEKYLSPELLTLLIGDWTAFEAPAPRIPAATSSHAITRPLLETCVLLENQATGLWIHEEDLSAETSPLADQSFKTLTVTAHAEAWDMLRFPETKRRWLSDALDDAATRAAAHWKVPAAVDFTTDLAKSLVTWAASNELAQIATLRPPPGPLADELPDLISELDQTGVRLVFVDRPSDLEFRPLGSGGFFKFWDLILKRGMLSP